MKGHALALWQLITSGRLPDAHGEPFAQKLLTLQQLQTSFE